MAERATNAQILQMLRVLGYSDDILGAPGAFNVTGTDEQFVERLRATGITDNDLSRAQDLAKIKTDNVPGVTQFLKTLGFDDKTVDATLAAGGVTSATKAGVTAPNMDKVFQAVNDKMGTEVGNYLFFGGQPPATMTTGPQFDDSLQAGRSQAKTGATAPVATAPAAAKPAAAPVPKPAGTATGAAGGTTAGGGPNNAAPPPAQWNDDQIKDFIKSNFGANAYFVDIPEVWDALKNVIKAGKGPAGLEPALETTQFWKQNTAAARGWYVKEKADPAQAAADVAQQGQAITNMAQQAGITIDPTRVSEIATSSLRYGWTQTDLQRAIGAEWHYDPSSKNQAAAVSKMKQDARNWLVPLSDQAIQTWGQGLMMGTTTDAQYQQYLRDNAKSLLPQLSSLIDAHASDPTFTVDHFVDPYRTTAANTLGIQADQIDFTDPKWRKALDQVDPKTNTRRIMSLSEWQSSLKSDPTYGYDKSANGIQDGVNLAQSLKQSMGF